LILISPPAADECGSTYQAQAPMPAGS